MADKFIVKKIKREVIETTPFASGGPTFAVGDIFVRGIVITTGGRVVRQSWLKVTNEEWTALDAIIRRIQERLSGREGTTQE